MPEPLSTLSPAKQNSRSSPTKVVFPHKLDRHLPAVPSESPPPPASAVDVDVAVPPTTDAIPSITLTMDRTLSSPVLQSPPAGARKAVSPTKYRLQEELGANNSPPGSPAKATGPFTQDLASSTHSSPAIGRNGATTHHGHHNDIDKDNERNTSTPLQDTTVVEEPIQDELDDFTLASHLDFKLPYDDTVGDLSSISAIPTDVARYPTSRTSPSKGAREPWSPSKQLRNSIITSTPGTAQRPLRLLSESRRSTSPDDDGDATPRQPRHATDAADLLNFTGQTNIVIPPPHSAPRTMRRTLSGRGAFPIKINPSPVHRSQASMDRERASGRSPQKPHTAPLEDRTGPGPATPASHRLSMYGAPGGLGADLLDIDLEPMATPRSIPTITPRELETLRSELQSRISGLEATLSGKEAEVMALKRAVTDAEVRVGKTSEELRTERASRDAVERTNEDLERRSRDMEEVLREVKQTIFLEEREKEKLRRQAEDVERQMEDQEVRILELQASLDTLRSDRIKSSPSPEKHAGPGTPGVNVTADIDFAVKDATEKVARELHALYKSKHERKVADLKVSYEKRWIKQVEQLRADLKASQDEVVKLQTEKEATMSGVVPGQAEALSKMEGQIEELRRWNDELSAEKKMVEAEAAGWRSQGESLRLETEALRKEIEQERTEKGELVAQVDLFLAISAQQEDQRAARSQRQPVSPPRSDEGNARPTSASAVASPNKYRNSMSFGATGAVSGVPARPRPMSMLQKPTGGKFSGIPGPGSGLKAPSTKTGGYGGRSGGIMEGIARMGGGGR